MTFFTREKHVRIILKNLLNDLFLLLELMEPKNTRPSSRKRSAPTLDKEFRFHSKYEKNDRGHRSLILGLKVRGDVILALSSGGEERRSHKGLSASPTRGAQKIGVP
jgi:hypothetical protein